MKVDTPRRQRDAAPTFCATPLHRGDGEAEPIEALSWCWVQRHAGLCSSVFICGSPSSLFTEATHQFVHLFHDPFFNVEFEVHPVLVAPFDGNASATSSLSIALATSVSTFFQAAR